MKSSLKVSNDVYPLEKIFMHHKAKSRGDDEMSLLQKKLLKYMHTHDLKKDHVLPIVLGNRIFKDNFVTLNFL